MDASPIPFVELVGQLGALGFIFWLVHRTTTHTIPRLAKGFEEATKEQRQDFAKMVEAQRQDFNSISEAQRDQCMEMIRDQRNQFFEELQREREFSKAHVDQISAAIEKGKGDG